MPHRRSDYAVSTHSWSSSSRSAAPTPFVTIFPTLEPTHKPMTSFNLTSFPSASTTLPPRMAALDYFDYNIGRAPPLKSAQQAGNPALRLVENHESRLQCETEQIYGRSASYIPPQASYQHYMPPEAQNHNFAAPLSDVSVVGTRLDGEKASNRSACSSFDDETYFRDKSVSVSTLEPSSHKFSQDFDIANKISSSASSSRSDSLTEENVAAVEIQEAQPTPFISKLSFILELRQHEDLIRWSPDGKSILIASHRPELLALLAKYFRHTTTASFVRQLNIYSFKRLSTTQLLSILESCNQLPTTSTSQQRVSAADFSAFAHPRFFRPEPGRKTSLSEFKPLPKQRSPRR